MKMERAASPPLVVKSLTSADAAVPSSSLLVALRVSATTGPETKLGGSAQPTSAALKSTAAQRAAAAAPHEVMLRLSAQKPHGEKPVPDNVMLRGMTA